MTARRRLLVLATTIATTAALMGWGPARAVPADGRGNVTVVAVIDNGFSPYYWDFLASKMPQATNADPSDDLPLDQPPHTWIPGFPDPSTFNRYDRFDLTLEEDNAARQALELDSIDAARWNTFRPSSGSAVNYHWFPRTKIVGALSFSSGSRFHATSNSTHGIGSSSVSVGSLFGSCPECVTVLIQYSSVAMGEAAIEWAMRQPWIDVITNSYGFSLVERDRLYSGSNTDLQRTATERGQTVFFSAGNGFGSAFLAPNTTLFSSQEGPDWIVTVGAVTTSGGMYTGAGKPADIAGVGSSYPSSYGSAAVGFKGSGGFGGTSNATPTIAGTYARALYLSRLALGSESRAQDGGVVARGTPVVCGDPRPDCELGDGVLTSAELRTRLFHGAVSTGRGHNPGGYFQAPQLSREESFLSEGHGTYFVRYNGDGPWLTEFARIFEPMVGNSDVLARSSDERDWMTVDSWCRQQLWGEWSGGYWRSGAGLPAPDPTRPLRTALQTSCPYLFPPV